MARHAAEVEAIVHRAIDEARKHIPVAEAFIFGSQVDGTAHEWSDIDLAVFTPAADTWDATARLAVVYAVGTVTDFVVEPHFFGMEARRNARPTNLVGHILQHGKRVT